MAQIKYLPPPREGSRRGHGHPPSLPPVSTHTLPLPKRQGKNGTQRRRGTPQPAATGAQDKEDRTPHNSCTLTSFPHTHGESQISPEPQHPYVPSSHCRSHVAKQAPQAKFSAPCPMPTSIQQSRGFRLTLRCDPAGTRTQVPTHHQSVTHQTPT